VAAQPIKRQLLADIKAAGGWDKIMERVASGESQTAIAASLGVSQGFFSRVIHLDAERVRAFREAKRLWAITLVERTGDLVSNVKENRDSIAKVREVAAHNRWEASKWDRELFGEDKGDVNVNVTTIAALHVDALRHRSVEAGQPLPAPLSHAPVPVAIPAAVPTESPAPAAPVAPERHGVEGDADAGTLWCHDCRRNDCRHAKHEYARQAQHYADHQPPGPRVLRGLV
jgi:hypothetical protein